MKFAHDFKQSLATQDFPPHWVDQAIPYSQLKKCLKKVQRELRELGLDPETLRSLLDPHNNSPVALQYKLNAASDSNLLRPKLTVNVHMRNGVPIDASLTSTSKDFLNKIASSVSQDQWKHIPHPAVEHSPGALDSDSTPPSASLPAESAPPSASPVLNTAALDASDDDTYETIEVPLVFDGEFFDILQSDVSNLDTLQAEEEEKLNAEIIDLGKEVAQVAKPSRFSKNDLARWRHIFELYLDAEVFFATHEMDHGARSSQVALKQLQWFQNQVETRGLANDFKLAESRAAFARFLKLNASLLKNLQFQELNKLAISKILKKFDKRTSLGISKAFPSAIQSNKLLAGNVAKDVCAQMSQELVSVVPQLNDYLCPVCFSLAYLPIRLDCQHVFCIRCVIKIQRRREKHCPLCRADVVMKASTENLDYELTKYLKKYFPKEAKEKQRSNEIERGIEDYGPGYVHKECIVM
ncbi:SPX domain-containing protein [Dactylonectria macrodidyma]|uniref:SPX domain-containing protein n=1 Tax=Dactylonectria macrodidyma TaxID=307937 RepID=A0A9P9FB48_9HYPO|nr:SPX domain-containing protein [Dactylonectria macrodidyma]